MYLVNIVIVICVFSAGFACGAAWNGMFRVNNALDKVGELHKNNVTDAS